MAQSTAAYRDRTKYDERKPRQDQMVKAGKHLAEIRLVDRAFALIPQNHRVLDVPSGGKKSQKFSTLLFEVKGYFQKTGFQISKGFAQFPLIHTMHLALFGRAGERAP